MTNELKSHNLCLRYPLVSLTQEWSRMRHCLMAESQHLVAVTLSRISDKLHLVYGQEVVYCLKFQRTYQKDRVYTHQYRLDMSR